MRSARRSDRVRAGTAAVRPRVEPIGTPLPHVARGVEQPVPVRWELVDRTRPGEAVGGRAVTGEPALEEVHPMCAFWFELVTPWEALALEPAASGELPFCFRRQPRA